MGDRATRRACILGSATLSVDDPGVGLLFLRLCEPHKLGRLEADGKEEKNQEAFHLCSLSGGPDYPRTLCGKERRVPMDK